MKKRKFLILILLILIFFLVLNPAQNIDSFFMGISVWATALLPALFPFFFFTKLLAHLHFPQDLGRILSPITKKLYNTDGISGYIFAMSILSGYPVGAKLTADFYESQLISREQAIRITAYTSTSGPLFVVGTVGIGMFASTYLGLVVLLSHFLSAITNGLLYRNYGMKKNKVIKNQNLHNFYNTVTTKDSQPTNILEDSMLSSIKSILIIGGYVAIFFMIITLLNNYNLILPLTFPLQKLLSAFSLPTNLSAPIINGLIEVTRGNLDLSKLHINIKLATIISSFIVSFGSFSVHAQAYTFLKKIRIPFSLYLLQKTTHACLSTIITILIVNIF